MKTALKFVLSLALVFVFMAGTAYAAGRVTVLGEGVVTFSPNIASVRIGVSTQEEDLSYALAQNTARIEAVTATLNSLGIPSSDIETGQFFIFPFRSWNEHGEIDMFMVENTLAITVRDLDMVTTVIEAAVGSGATNVNWITFDNTNREAYYLRALDLAVRDGVAKAGILANAMEMPLGSISSIEEEFAFMGSMARAMGFDMISPPNELSVSAAVRMTFE